MAALQHPTPQLTGSRGDHRTALLVPGEVSMAWVARSAARDVRRTNNKKGPALLSEGVVGSGASAIRSRAPSPIPSRRTSPSKRHVWMRARCAPASSVWLDRYGAPRPVA